MRNLISRIAAVFAALFCILFSLRGDELTDRLTALSNAGNWAELRKEAADALRRRWWSIPPRSTSRPRRRR